jgi:hypothetical protein
LIRGVGPGLEAMNVAGPLTNPIVHLYRDDELIATNDNWGNTLDYQTAAAQSGAFALSRSEESALLVTLPPGTYTAHVVSADGTAGIALVEIYALP